MKTLTLIPIIMLTLLLGCQPAPPSADKDAQNELETPEADSATPPVMENLLNQNADFEAYKERFLKRYWELHPSYAVYVGYYAVDDKLAIPNGAARSVRRDFFVNQLEVLSGFDAVNLSVSNATDLAIMIRHIKANLWYIDKFRSFEWDPSQYNVAGTFGLILNTDYKPLGERLATINARLAQVPAYYAAAQKNIKTPTLPHLGLALQQSRGALSVFTTSIPEKLSEFRQQQAAATETPNETLAAAELEGEAETAGEEDTAATPDNSEADQELEQSVEPLANFEGNLQAAIDAIQAYIDFLLEKQNELAVSGAKDFRIGQDLYEEKFAHDIVSNYTAKELYELALQAKEQWHAEMIEITQQLWPEYFPDEPIPEDDLLAVKQLIDQLSLKHVAREDFVEEIRRQLPIIQKFMDDNELLDSDPSRPLVVRVTPAYQRGFAGASIDAPGPYDATANTYYNVSPLDEYSEEQAESWLREYNHWILQLLNIHEAIPGHYTQLMHANKSPSKIKAIFANGAMIEGWANYSERMMLEAGYGDNEPEMRLMYGKWYLRVIVNTILDYSIHVLGMEKEEAMDLMLNQAFQEQAEADGKWRRATVSQVQLTSYFSGSSEIYAFREELKQKLGDKFNLREFHNKFLSYGNAPVPIIRALMLGELEANAEQEQSKQRQSKQGQSAETQTNTLEQVAPPSS